VDVLRQGAWLEVFMSAYRVPRRSFFESLLALPLGLAEASQRTSPAPRVAKVAAGAGRFNAVTKLPGGDLLYVKVATQDTAGAFFMTEQPIDRRGFGPPKHYHEEQDEWWYCLAGEYVVEIGDQRFRLTPGDSVLGPRRVPHAFAYDGVGTGRLLVGFTPAGRMERFFSDLERRGQYFGSGTPQDKETARREYGIVNVGPPLSL
jgi:mannose-6-phosphate isomerase-like protein (cupin superfamily)